MSMRRVLLAVLAIGVLTSCTDGGNAQDDDGGTEPLSAEAVGSRFQQDPVIPENGTAPEAFVDRERLPSCGSYAWTLEDEGPPDHLWRCLAVTAAKGNEAELIVQSPGIDSTSIRYYRVAGEAQQVEFWSRDTMADRWARGTCESLDAETGPSDCNATEMFG